MKPTHAELVAYMQNLRANPPSKRRLLGVLTGVKLPKKAATKMDRGPEATPKSPPPLRRGPHFFGPETDWVEFELAKVVRPQRVVVPGGVWGGGDRAHRREVVP